MKTPSALYEKMLAAANPAEVPGLMRFFKTGPGQYGEGDKFLGIKTPVTRSVVKECWRITRFEELEECICSEYHEVRLAALLTLVEIFKHAKRPPIWSEGTSYPASTGHLLQQRCIDFYLSHTEYINNWDLVDLSCYPLLGEWLLSAEDRSLLYNLARDGKTIWEQRIGIVSTMTFVRHGQFSDTFAIADILLHHQHDLIHKAVGWLLREAGKRNQAALEAYLRHSQPDRKSPRYKEMPRTMLRYAIEKFPEPERQRFLWGKA
ncbi:MAG: DNA alkylation repair protein [Bacteroidales bacterium]|nr:DNA alkylation repair protein [Bacteroidales bacterium]